MSGSIADRVIALVQEQLGAEHVTRESNFVDDLGADSLDVIELTMAIEERFDLDLIPDEDVDKAVTVGDAIDYLEKKLNG